MENYENISPYFLKNKKKSKKICLKNSVFPKIFNGKNFVSLSKDTDQQKLS